MTGEFVNKGESQSIINNFIMLLAESSYSMDDIKSKVEDSIIAIIKILNLGILIRRYLLR